jgi:dTDP-4-amino-4,6-dideoxygalactose transaminase
MGPILEVARAHDLAVMEDCAQAYDAYYRGKMVGTFGEAACYSLQQSKHITSGEGGIVITDDPVRYTRAVLYSNCGMPWYRYGIARPQPVDVAGLATRGHFAFGHNYRMTELQGAVALAQLAKLGEFSARRAELAAVIEEELGGVPGIGLAHTYADTAPNYWAYPLRLDPQCAELTTADLGLDRYNEVNYLEQIFQQMQQERRTSVGCPLPDYVRYEPGICPRAEHGAQRLFTMWPRPSVDPDELRSEARMIADVVSKAVP